ncbi:hypothetical protein GCM10010168_79820 [Actinoplanes ianthinogenes]|uniref:Clumping factor A n=1 Tax=Actinoplanes ianthinogenes TaxID=122358 RepID=A0ABN6CKB5_9ACTN|nr:hypothetical protein Aiant_61030 [Actinoplanes ianthinogenes]GGR49104.1 hypothetical protein GCM10010168_79820 [Actinoplanes ianthinogenes]
MIPASLPLILVGVVCLAIGLIRGSSSLLIASIVASLLAAVALVIGLRQKPPARRAADADLPDEAVPTGPPPRRTSAAPSDAHDSAPDGAASAADSGYPGDTPHAAASYASDSPEPAESSATAGRTDPIGFPAGSADPVYADQAPADQGDTVDLPGAGETTGGAPAAGTHLPDETPAAADYHAASSTIGAARSTEADDQSWRRPAATPGGPARADGPDSPDAAESTAQGRGFPAQASASGVTPADSGPLGDEFGEPDADDPDDEPLPQSVRPTDAVQVARLDTEVLVVDGRPRYHMADCPHLVGRLTEPLPAAEAVELGFSPCGLCRPVDRLLGANVHH